MFALSKLVWLVVDPLSVLTLLIAASALAAWRRHWRWVKALLAAQVVMLLTLGVVPTGKWMLGVLEDRIPATPLPERVDGVVVLGGALDPLLSARRGQPVLNDAAERLTTFAALAHRYPGARLVVSGGNGLLLTEQPPETQATAALMVSLGVDPSRLVLEATSRNTFENAVNSAALVHPAAAETWVLVTSAAHMPRALSVFRRQGWAVLPCPVDYRTSREDGEWLNPMPLHGLAHVGEALHEVLGLLAYRALDRTDAWWPGP